MQLTLDATDNRPIYIQIVDEVRRGLARGTLGPEDPLPSVRELASRLRINPRTVMQAYATAGTARHQAMVEKIRDRLHLTSLKYQSMDDLVAAIGLPKQKLCTHCWDGSSYY